MINYICSTGCGSSIILLLPPLKKSDADFSHGINFAVAGSTALPWEALAALDISSQITNSSLSLQLDWMSSYFHTLCRDDRGTYVPN